VGFPGEGQKMASFARNAGFLFPERRLFISGTVALFRRIMQMSQYDDK
jgi:hypothetical protein